jgi:hypothetical protein
MPVPGKSDGYADTASIEVELTIDRRGAEALSLELRRLAKAQGLEIGSLTVMPAGDHPTSPEGATSP